MARRLSRRPSPGHPTLFDTATDIPPAPPLPDPEAALAMERYRAVLDEAGAIPLEAVGRGRPGLEVVVAGRREAAEWDDHAVAILDDGTARIRLSLADSASAPLRDAVRSRLLLLTARAVGDPGGSLWEVTAARDLRRIGDDYDAAQRASRQTSSRGARRAG